MERTPKIISEELAEAFILNPGSKVTSNLTNELIDSLWDEVENELQEA